MTVALSLPADGLVAGRDETLRYHIVDAKTGLPVTNLEPYLAAYGHTLVLSEDTMEYVHAHPVELLPEKADTAAGGPELTFTALLPKPGRYRLWTQLKRGGVVSTVRFTVTAASPAAISVAGAGRWNAYGAGGTTACCHGSHAPIQRAVPVCAVTGV